MNTSVGVKLFPPDGAAKGHPHLLIENNPQERWRLAVTDLADGMAQWRIWTALGWADVLQRYRRSVLGPFWLTMSMAIMVLSLGILYGTLFKISIRDFLPFVCVGILVWSFISALLVEGGNVFISCEHFIKQMRMPFTMYVWRFVWAKVVTFAHHFLIYVGVIIYFAIWPGKGLLLAVPAFLLLIVNGLLVSLYLGMIATRFRDVPQIVAAAVQVIFFLTPVLWKPELLSGHRFIVDMNPFYHFIELLRDPLLGLPPSIENWAVACGVTLFNAALAGVLFVRFRARIAYWI